MLGAGVDNRDHDAVRAFIRQAADIGLSLLFIHPGTKVPADMRTATKRNADDKATREAAREAGRRDWAVLKSPAGLALATSDKKVLDAYLTQYVRTFSTWKYTDGQPAKYAKKQVDAGEIVIDQPAAVNLAIEVGGSALVVVDCDTAAQVDRFFAAAEIGPDERPAPTVLTPGSIGDHGDAADPSTWGHADGGHFYFTVPDELIGVLPRNVGAMTWGGDHGFAVLWDRRYVLIPPSTRPEGAYEQLGDDYPLPEWLLEKIVEAGHARLQRAERSAERAEAANPELRDAVDAWAETVGWDAILEPLGWTMAPRADSCGCPVWTGPGDHQSPKSATSHDSGCSAGRYTEVNAPLHFWTDNPDPPFDQWCADHHTKTITKLQAVALVSFGGNMGKAMDELDLSPDKSVDDPEIERRTNPDAGETAATGDGDFDLPTPPAQDETVDYCHRCNSAKGLFVADDNGVQWHAVDADDAAETGGHRADGVVTDPRTGDVLYTTSTVTNGDGEVIGIEQVPVPAVEISFDPADLPADFGKKIKGPVEGVGGTGYVNLNASPYADHVADPDPDVFESVHPGVPRIAPFSHWRNMPPPEYVIDGLIEHGGLSAMIGPPGMGKSTVVLDMLCHIAAGKRWRGRQTLKTRVLYLPGEGLPGVVQRLRAWEAVHGITVEDDMLLGDSIIQVKAQNEAWGDIGAYIARQEIGLVVFDTFARMASGLEENSATDVGIAIRRFDRLKKLTNVGVLVVHHTGKTNDGAARGSSALNGALDSELLIKAASWDTSELVGDGGQMPGRPMELHTSKQKNAEQLEHPIQLLMMDATETYGIKAPYMTGPTGTIDPMQGDVVMARPIPQPIVEIAIRIRDYLDTVPQQGATRSELASAVRADAYSRSREDGRAYWRQRINEAVDRALRFELIETLTGTASGSRYIPSTGTRESARTRAAAEIEDD